MVCAHHIRASRHLRRRLRLRAHPPRCLARGAENYDELMNLMRGFPLSRCFACVALVRAQPFLPGVWITGRLYILLTDPLSRHVLRLPADFMLIRLRLFSRLGRPGRPSPCSLQRRAPRDYGLGWIAVFVMSIALLHAYRKRKARPHLVEASRSRRAPDPIVRRRG